MSDNLLPNLRVIPTYYKLIRNDYDMSGSQGLPPGFPHKGRPSRVGIPCEWTVAIMNYLADYRVLTSRWMERGFPEHNT